MSIVPDGSSGDEGSGGGNSGGGNSGGGCRITYRGRFQLRGRFAERMARLVGMQRFARKNGERSLARLKSLMEARKY